MYLLDLTMTHTLLPRTLCSLGTLCIKVAWYTLHPKSLSFSTHFLTYFTPQHTLLLLSTLYSSAHFARRKPCSLEYFPNWNTLLHGTFYFLEHVCKVS